MDDLATRQFLELERLHWWFEGRRRVFFSVLRDLLGTRRDLRILDVGCGVGGMMEELREWGEPTGLELSEPMLKLARVKRLAPRAFTKSGIMLGLGETRDEVLALMDDLRAVDVDFLTIGQYLRPTPRHAEVKAWVEPAEIFA